MKPRARYSAEGGDAGYWVVRSFRNGWLFQGVGFTLEGAYEEWQHMVRTWRKPT